MYRLSRLLALVFVLTLCAGGDCQPEGDCQAASDCPTGQICNALHQCVDPHIVPPQDAGPRDLRRPDRFAPDNAVDTGPEDAPPTDSSQPDSTVVDSSRPDTAPVDAGPPQVTQINTCDEPQALALSDDASLLYVACGAGDAIRVYDAVSGALQRTLNALPQPCMPRALQLREDVTGGGQLWVGCAAPTNQTVNNVDPVTGARLEPTGFSPGGISGQVRFASAGDYVAWVAVGATNYYVRRINNRSSTAQSHVGANANLGGDLAMTSDGASYYVTNNQSNILYKLDTSSSGLQQLPMTNLSWSTQVAISPTVSTAPAQPVLVVVSASQRGYVRMREDGTELGQGLVSVDVAQEIALTMRQDGRFAYLVSSGDQRIYKISTDPADNTPTEGSLAVTGCQAYDVAAAVDGRVFVACRNLDRVQVVLAGQL